MTVRSCRRRCAPIAARLAGRLDLRRPGRVAASRRRQPRLAVAQQVRKRGSAYAVQSHRLGCALLGTLRGQAASVREIGELVRGRPFCSGRVGPTRSRCAVCVPSARTRRSGAAPLVRAWRPSERPSRTSRPGFLGPLKRALARAGRGTVELSESRSARVQSLPRSAPCFAGG